MHCRRRQAWISPPYSPDYNPIEEAFAEFKAWLKAQLYLLVSEYETYGEFLEAGLQVIDILSEKSKMNIVNDIIMPRFIRTKALTLPTIENDINMLRINYFLFLELCNKLSGAILWSV